MVKNQAYYFGISVIFSVFLMSFLAAATISPDLHLNIQTTDGSGNVVTGTYDFAFNITTDDACSNVVYSNSTSLTTDSRGIVSYYLENVNLDFDEQYYLCYYRNESLIETSQIARTPYSFTAQNTTTSGLTVDSSLDFSGYNLTADYFFGDGRYLTNLNVSEIDLSDYFTKTEIINFDYYNNSNFPYTHLSNFTNDGVFINWGHATNGTLALNSSLANYYPLSNPYGFVNSTTASGVYVPYTGSNANVVLGDYNFSVGTSDFFVDASSGNVGIGTTAPGVALDVAGIISSSSDVLAGGSVQATSYFRGPYVTPFTSGGNFDIRNYAGDTSYLSVNTTSGNVGVGNTNPSYKLDVVGDVNAYDLLVNGTSINATTVGAVDASGTANYVAKFSDSDTLTNSVIYDDGSSVGIGTTVPDAKLDIVQGGGLNLRMSSTSGVAMEFGADTDGVNQEWRFTGDGLQFKIRDHSNSNDIFSIQAGAPEGSFYVGSTGKVGIGTTSPSYRLDTAGDINAYRLLVNGSEVATTGSANVTSSGSVNYVPYFTSSSNLGDSVIYQNGTNVGIGTTAPGTKLEIAGNLSIKPGSYPAAIRIGGNTAGWEALQASSGTLLELNPGSNFANVGIEGNVGIGTTEPGYKLDVAGDSRFDSVSGANNIKIDSGANQEAGFLFQNDGSNKWQLAKSSGDGFFLYGYESGISPIEITGSTGNVRIGNATDSKSLYVVSSTGNVGIGTTTPTQKLEVSGNANVTANLTVNGMTIYKDTGGNMVFRV